MLAPFLTQISRHFKIFKGCFLLLALPLPAQAAGYSQSLISKIVSGGLLGGAAGAISGASQEGKTGAKGATGPIGAAGADNATVGAPGDDFAFTTLPAGNDFVFYFFYDGTVAPTCRWRGIVTTPHQEVVESGEFDGVSIAATLIGGTRSPARVGTYTITFHQTTTGPAPAKCECWVKNTLNPYQSRYQYTFPNTTADQQMSFTFTLDPDVLLP